MMHPDSSFAGSAPQPELWFVHGAGGSPAHWVQQMAEMPAATAVCLPSHSQNEGATNPGPVFSSPATLLEAYAGWLHDQLAGRRVIMAGHSMGGAVAITYALKYPGQLAGLVLAGTGARLRVSPQILELLQTDFPAALRLIIDYCCRIDSPEEFKAGLQAGMEQVGQAVTSAEFQACHTFDATTLLPGLAGLPTLVITGQEDRMTPPKFATFLAGNIPSARLELIAGAGHFLQLEKPDEFNRALLEFARRIGG